MRGMLFVFSWAIVAFGQPAWIPWIAPFAAGGGYALFWMGVHSFDRKKKFLLGSCWFAAVQMIQLSWMTATEFQGWYILGVYLFLLLGLGVQFGLLTTVVGRWPHVTVAAFWTLLEWSRLYFLCGFSWNPVGLSLTSFTVPLQMASIGGVFGLSFWVILTNLALLHRRWVPFLVCATFPYLFGVAHLAYHEGKLRSSEKLNLGLIQTGLLPPEKILMQTYADRFISPLEQWHRILKILQNCRQKIDLLIFPEFAVPVTSEAKIYPARVAEHMFLANDQKISFLEDKISNRDWAQAISNLWDTEVVIGLDAQDQGSYFASAFHLKPRKSDVDRYDKQILVPLAEYLPFSWLKKWTELYGITEFFTPGFESRIFQGPIPFTISICYEETFPALIRQGRVKGSQLLVNLTNDNWYPASKLPKQHYSHGRVRSVENGVPLARSCNTGITAAFDSLGRCIGSIEKEKERNILQIQLPLYHYRTLYTFFGDSLIVGLSCLFLLFSVNHLACFKRIL